MTENLPPTELYYTLERVALHIYHNQQYYASMSKQFWELKLLKWLKDRKIVVFSQDQNQNILNPVFSHLKTDKTPDMEEHAWRMITTHFCERTT